ncbi:MAG: hypothetical protein JOZ69_11265 [Myxococcales bacterium]|nr:hypothetical protein [Myxococcales bacterium]
MVETTSNPISLRVKGRQLPATRWTYRLACGHTTVVILRTPAPWLPRELDCPACRRSSGAPAR